jgi:FlaA1/EpsC-like NDP-sugar epimerase
MHGLEGRMPMSSSNRSVQSAIIIGLNQTCRRLEQQLELLESPPRSVGWIVIDGDAESRSNLPILGTLRDLEPVVERLRPSLALVSLPAVMKDLIWSIRTRLRKVGIPDRFMPTLEDQVEGIGPRTHLDVELSALLGRRPRQVDEAAVQSVIKKKRVLITGAGGSIGSELSRIVARFEPSSLTLVDRSENALFEIDRQVARSNPGLPRKALLHDIVEPASTLSHFRALRPQVIFHAAAHKHVPMMEDHPSAAVDNNLFGTKSVADAAHETGAERFVMISTDKAVNPCSIMGATKRLAELYVQYINQRSSTGFSMVRFGNVLGSSGSVLETWARQIADGGPMTVTDPRMTRYFMTIPEAATLVIQSAALIEPTSPCGEVFLLNMGEPIRVVDLARRFIQLHGLADVSPEDRLPLDGPGSIRILYTGARPGEKLHEELAFDAEAMRPTRHPDINIWEIPAPDEEFIRTMLDRLSPKKRWADPNALAHEIRGLIPEIQQPVAA